MACCVYCSRVAVHDRMCSTCHAVYVDGFGDGSDGCWMASPDFQRLRRTRRTMMDAFEVIMEVA